MHCFPGPLARIAGYRVHDAEQANPGDKEEKHEEKCHLRNKRIMDYFNDLNQCRKKAEGASTHTLSSLISKYFVSIR